ncbi:hypothetical protein C7Y69_06120 [Alteromonas sp. KS69]|jgi:hypothetical protein|uniref:Uncharacterized protein n=1 Tax=Alteromonas naphthalenivorans TaxID=715451 RepID=F5ZG19_ALTNA|nr:hypothetical protein ambt_21480 [Alteromonas naphthalenivorans]PHS58104.1 MAG: hypothetical protein COB03_04840 [Alteromonas sp.]RUP82154.1 hypothetical protein C7Y69_06120 [Alteromonas sp. KS69]|tara:strand:- start:2552 stop:2740 length:189 start_codon:yes stop_codon:yes gene_type:complete
MVIQPLLDKLDHSLQLLLMSSSAVNSLPSSSSFMGKRGSYQKSTFGHSSTELAGGFFERVLA